MRCGSSNRCLHNYECRVLHLNFVKDYINYFFKLIHLLLILWNLIVFLKFVVSLLYSTYRGDESLTRLTFLNIGL